ncbi:hypothetical protein GCM10023212_15830 [Luteolibacter yonseiensis]
MAFSIWLGSPSMVSADDVRFSARIDEILITRQFDKKVIVTGIDPRHLLRVTLEQDVEGVGKRGESVSFAIHSPARDLGISDPQAAVGNRMLLTLGTSNEGGIRHLRRIKTDRTDKAPATDGRPAK